MPMASSCRRLSFCSGVSVHALLMPPPPPALFPELNFRARCFVGSSRAARSSWVGGMVIQSSLWAFFGASLNCGSVSNALFAGMLSSYALALYVAPAGGGAGPKSSSLLSESSEGGLGGRSSSGAGGAAGPMTRAGLDAGAGAGPTSLSGELDREADSGGRVGPAVRGEEAVEGGRAGPATLRRLSLASGLGARSPSSSRLRLEGCGGIAGPIEGIVRVCVVDV